MSIETSVKDRPTKSDKVNFVGQSAQNEQIESLQFIFASD